MVVCVDGSLYAVWMVVCMLTSQSLAKSGRFLLVTVVPELAGGL